MTTTLVTTTWNSLDHLEVFLAHYRKLGLDRVLLMDFDSTDGTDEVLRSPEWLGLVERVPFPGIAGLDSSNDMLAIAQSTASADDWCLFGDPDELLVTPSMQLDELVAAGEAAGADWLTIPRFNVTAPRSLAQAAPQRLNALDGLQLRIDRRARRAGAAEIPEAVLAPAWIYTALPGKVFVRTQRVTAIGEGDHSARSAEDRHAAPPAGIYLLHYPFRRYEAFAEKIDRARRGFEANPHLAPSHGWQLRRWIRLAQEGILRMEYDLQFVDDADLPGQIADGSLSRDLSVLRFQTWSQ